MASANAASSDWEAACGRAHETAQSIMHIRQNGGSMPKLMKIFHGNSESNKAWQDVVIAAYDKPRFSTEAGKAREEEDFSNEIYAECVKALRK